MPSSELSDALNPNVVRQRNYDEVLLYQDQQAYPNLQHLNFPVDQQQYQYHRSELELAVVEPSPVQRYSYMSLIDLRCIDELAGRVLHPLIPHRSSYES